MPDLSVCVLAHNEEANIERAIASVAGWAAEVIVVDCQSSDATAQIAARLGAIVHLRPNLPAVDLNKNNGFELASREWILSLDADEEIPEELKTEIDGVLSRKPAENGFTIPRRNFYFGVPLMHGGNYPDRQLRLFRRGRGRFTDPHSHEPLKVEGRVGTLAASFNHYPYPNFDVWLRKFDFYTNSEASRLRERGVAIDRSTIRHYMITRPLRRWTERLFIKRGIRDGVPGILAATFDLMTHVVGFGKYWASIREQSGENEGRRAGRTPRAAGE